MQKNIKATTSHVSIIAIFIMLVLFLSIPLVIFSTQQKQDIRQRASGILPTQELLQPQDGNGYISGYVYLDRNKNGQRDYMEESLGRIQIKISQTNQEPDGTSGTSNLETTLSTDENGFFKYELTQSFSQPVSFIVQLVLPNLYKTVNTNPVIIANVNNEAKETVGFGIFPIEPIFFTPSSSPRLY